MVEEGGGLNTLSLFEICGEGCDLTMIGRKEIRVGAELGFLDLVDFHEDHEHVLVVLDLLRGRVESLL